MTYKVVIICEDKESADELHDLMKERFGDRINLTFEVILKKGENKYD